MIFPFCLTVAIFPVHFHVSDAGVMFGRKNPANFSCDGGPVVS